MGSRVKEEERNERAIRGLLKLPGNNRCINCNSMGPQYVCTSFSTFICINCSGIHREFTHRVKSISLAKFTSQEVSALQEGGNERAKEIYFKNWDSQGQPVPDSSDVYRLRNFIKNVYVDRRYTGERIGDHPPQVKGSRDGSYGNNNADSSRGVLRSPYGGASEDNHGPQRSTASTSEDQSNLSRHPITVRMDQNNRSTTGRENTSFTNRQHPDELRKTGGRSENNQMDVTTSISSVVEPSKDTNRAVLPIKLPDPPRPHKGTTSTTCTEAQVTDAGLARLKDMPMPVKTYVGASNVQIRNLTLTKKGVKLFIKDNGLSLGEVKDLIWGLIACNLYHMGLINMNHYSGTDEGITEADEGLLNDDFLTRYSTLTRAVVVLALVSYCQGGWEDGMRWYESFCNVQGDFLNESRLRNTIKLIIAGKKFAKIMTVITINDVRGLNNVFTYRLKRFSAPKLVKQAMEILPYPHILKYFAESHVKHYKIIDEAGLIAQIAGGPLRAFCTGVADPLRIGSSNGHLALASLAPFPDFPEYDDVIRKAYIILKAAKYNFGMWYQGERAMRAYTASDMKFKSIVEATLDKLQKEADRAVDLDSLDTDGVMAASDGDMKFKSIVEATLDKLQKEADRAVDLDSLDTDGVMAASDGVEVLNLLSSWKYSR